MKLLLINPFDKNTGAFSNHFPPLSMGYIAALTPPDWKIEFLDENFDEFTPRKADLVAITAMTVQANRAYEICGIYKKMGVPVVMGGIHASMVPEEASTYATSVVIGEAENLWPNVICDFLTNSLQPLYWNDSPPSLDHMVIARRDLFSKKYRFDCIQTSRGCPFSCDFCSVPVFNGRAYRLRPVEEVVEELRTINKKLVFFVDDNIVGVGQKNEERAVALFEEILRRGIKKHWISQASLNISKNDYLLRLMKKTGCLGLLIGFESLDKRTLQSSGKSQNLRDSQEPEHTYQEFIKKLHKHEIAVNGYFCFGYEDTSESMHQSLDFILHSDIDITNTPILIPSPGTALHKKLWDKIEFKDYPGDWNKYLGRLVYTPRNMAKKEFYRSYILLSQKLNSLRQVFRRALRSLKWTGSPFQTLMILLFNLGYRKMRRAHLAFLSKNDNDFRASFL
jgi:radical SAM superfamily enzyme YgiQ (UPF0313 family)